MLKNKNIQIQLGTIFWKVQCALYGVVAAATMFEAFTRKLPATFLLLSLEKSDDLSMDSQSQKSQAYNARQMRAGHYYTAGRLKAVECDYCAHSN